VFQQVEADLGPVSVLVYNPTSGVWPPITFEETSLDQFKQGIDSQAVGAFVWCKKVGLTRKKEDA
jgi:hypothetical protein